MPRKQTQPEIVQRMRDTHNNRYDYSQVIYVNSKSKVTILCPMCGPFTQTPEAHIRGQGCPACRMQRTIETNLSRYGVAYTTQDPATQTKMKHTLLTEYGHSNPAHGVGAQQKIIATNNLRFGTDHPLQSPAIRQRIIDTCTSKYGVPFASQQTNTTAANTLQDGEWLLDQYVKLNKTAIQIAEELGVCPGTIGNYLRKHKIQLNIAKKYSRSCIKWLDSVSKFSGAVIQHALNGGEYKIPGTRYRADGYCADTNTIYEFHGDIYHGNPQVFDSTVKCHPFNDKTAGELYADTQRKEQTIRELGYNLVVMWERDFK